MKSIYVRNFLASAAMIGLCLLFVSFSIVGIGRGYLREEYSANMVNSAGEMARTAGVIAEEDSLKSWTLAMMLSSVSKASGNHFFVTDPSGIIVTCCDMSPLCEHLGHAVSESVIKEISVSGLFQSLSTTFDGILEQESIAVGLPVKSTDGSLILGYIFVDIVESNILSSWSTFLGIILIVFVGIFVALLIFSFWYSRHMTRPLDDIAAASRMFARGDFSKRVNQTEDPSTEMGALIDSFNKMADSLESSEKRSAEFISNISHELRTPMTTISGFADGILDGTIPKEEEEKYLISIRDETRRLARLVREMLDASRAKTNSGDRSRRTVFDLNELVLQTLLSFESRATQKNLDVDPQIPEQSVMVTADKDGITRVIYNLLDNAIKFSHDGGCITLKLYKDGEKAFVSVKDQGETIPPEDLPYIFDRFHKSDHSRSIDKDGVGLGLSLVKTILNNHDEDIAVKSENGETEFVFTLPLAENK